MNQTPGQQIVDGFLKPTRIIPEVAQTGIAGAAQ
jgi:hypothetical protein